MHRLFPLIGALLATAPLVARATYNPLSEGHRVGVGVGGGPAGLTGATAKMFLKPEVSAQAMVGQWWGRGVALGVDGLIEMPQFSARGPVTANWFVGAGAAVFVSSGLGLGVSAVLGASVQAKAAPIELVAEYRPSFFLRDAGHWSWNNWGGAIRYYF